MVNTQRKLALKIAWVGIGLILIILFLLIIWLTLLRPQPINVSLINFYREPVVVKFLDSEIKLEVFDTYSEIFDIHPNQEIVFSVYDTGLEKVGSHTLKIGGQKGLVMQVLSENNNFNQCVVELNVHSVFYPDSEQDLSLTETLSSEPSSGIYIPFQTAPKNYMYLDHYSGNDLPESLNKYQELPGYYFVDCNHSGDINQMTAEVEFWTVYDPGVQRELYKQELEDIKNDPSYTN